MILAIVLNQLVGRMLAHLDQDEWDLALLVFKRCVHTLSVQALLDRPLNPSVALYQSLDSDVLLHHLLQLLHFFLDAIIRHFDHVDEICLFFSELELNVSHFGSQFFLLYRSLFSCLLLEHLLLLRIFDDFLRLLFFFCYFNWLFLFLFDRDDRLADAVHEVLEFSGQILIEIHVQSYLLAILHKDIAGQEDVQ